MCRGAEKHPKCGTAIIFKKYNIEDCRSRDVRRVTFRIKVR